MISRLTIGFCLQAVKIKIVIDNLLLSRDQSYFLSDFSRVRDKRDSDKRKRLGLQCD